MTINSYLRGGHQLRRDLTPVPNSSCRLLPTHVAQRSLSISPNLRYERDGAELSRECFSRRSCIGGYICGHAPTSSSQTRNRRIANPGAQQRSSRVIIAAQNCRENYQRPQIAQNIRGVTEANMNCRHDSMSHLSLALLQQFPDRQPSPLDATLYGCSGRWG